MSKDLPSRIGRYDIVRLLGQGSLGPVYLALDPKLDRHVAIKVIAIDDVDLARQTARAAHAAAALHHPNILTIYDVAESDGQPFIAMEYLDGETLADVAARGDLPMDRRLELIERLCEALAYAHDHGVLHTNIQPGEVFVTRDGVVRVPLLGLARLRLGSSMSTTGVIVGTLQYLSPEQVTGAEVDHRSDVFSVGLVLYEILTSTRAYPGEGTSVLQQILTSAPTPASQLNAQIGPALEAIIDKALHKEPLRRYQTMRDFAAALARIRSELDLTRSSQAPAILYERPAHSETAMALSPDAIATPRRIDENVQFSVYRPPAIEPAKWYSMLVFAHLSSRRPDAASDEPDPLEEVGRRAKALLGNRVTAPASRVDALAAIPEEGQLRVVPHVPGIAFNPPEHAFVWVHSIHQVEFALRADVAMQGRTARGSLDVYLGAVAVAHIPLAIPVEAQVDPRERRVSQTANPYRKLFASYSHKDEAVVRQFENYAKGLGDRYLRDVLELRAGEVWNSRLLELIEAADVFQLFWSRNAMDSVFVRQEWEHALSVAKPDFIRPVYWELPFPEREGLPPIDLSRLHFAFVSAPAATVAEPVDPPEDAGERDVARERAEHARHAEVEQARQKEAARARHAEAERVRHAEAERARHTQEEQARHAEAERARAEMEREAARRLAAAQDVRRQQAEADAGARAEYERRAREDAERARAEDARRLRDERQRLLDREQRAPEVRAERTAQPAAPIPAPRSGRLWIIVFSLAVLLAALLRWC